MKNDKKLSINAILKCDGCVGALMLYGFQIQRALGELSDGAGL
jgi:hypothetical protein